MADADNIFDVNTPPTPPSDSEPESEPQVESVEPLKVTKYELGEFISVYPGWSAIYDNPNKSGEIIMFPVCAMGKVTLTYEDNTNQQELRHFVALPTGSVRDAFGIPDFVCVVAPGQKIEDVVAAVKTERQMA